MRPASSRRCHSSVGSKAVVQQCYSLSLSGLRFSYFCISKCIAPHLAFASARLMVLRWLVAGRALDRVEEVCSIRYDKYVSLYDVCRGEGPDIFICHIALVRDLVSLFWHLPRRAAWHFVGWSLDGRWILKRNYAVYVYDIYVSV